MSACARSISGRRSTDRAAATLSPMTSCAGRVTTVCAGAGAPYAPAAQPSDRPASASGARQGAGGRGDDMTGIAGRWKSARF
ncbi:Uncharacterised protein [Bordetella pertussis]|nr:Uncharacterised protein [Bordetella pertussis]CFW31117.1 Uncharacterised protein [Bordetella pertussis]